MRPTSLSRARKCFLSIHFGHRNVFIIVMWCLESILRGLNRKNYAHPLFMILKRILLKSKHFQNELWNVQTSKSFVAQTKGRMKKIRYDLSWPKWSSEQVCSQYRSFKCDLKLGLNDMLPSTENENRDWNDRFYWNYSNFVDRELA